MYEFYYEGGGEVPQDLKGLFTDSFQAQKAKNNYLSTRYVRKPKK